MVEKTYELPELWVKKIESKLSYNDSKIKEFRNFLEANWKNIKALQTNLNKLLEKKWYVSIAVDWKAGWQTFEAIRIFENDYRNKNIEKVEGLTVRDVSDAMSWITIELREMNKEKNQKLQSKFEKAKIKAPQKERIKAKKELDQVDQDKQKETTKVIKATKKKLDTHKKMILNNKLMKTIMVKNEKWDSVPVKFSKWFSDKFNIVSGKNNLEFQSKDALILFNFDVKVEAQKKKNSSPYMPEYTYNFHLKLPKAGWVNFYEKEVSWDENMNQVYYSFKKNGKVYLWVVWFQFDNNSWSIKNFRVVEKELKNTNSPLTKDELSNYEWNVYYSWIFDFSWYTIKKWTTINNINHMDVWTAEKTYDELEKKYPNEIALKWALQFIWTKIATNSTLRDNFPIWWIDKEGIWTWDILWAVITLHWLKESWLNKQLETLYNMINKWTLTNVELKKVSQDIAKYPHLDKFTSKEKIKWLADQNDSWKIWDMTNTIIWEKTVYELMWKLSEGQAKQKINEILTLAGCPENLKDTYFAKPYFYRWLERLNLDPLSLKKYLSWKMNLADVEKNRVKLQERNRHDILLNLLWTEEKVKEFEKKVQWKYNELKTELEKRLSSNYKNDPSIFERLKASIEYTGITAAYIDHTRKQDTIWWSVNFSTDWKIIDNLSLWLVSVDGQLIPWISVWKSFSQKFDDKRTSIWIAWNLINGVIPLLSVSASHDFNKAWLEKWDSSSKKIVTSIWTAFPILFGSLWYNFGKAGQIEYKEAKLNRVLNGMFEKLNKWEKLQEKDYSDKYEKELVRSINSMIKIAKLGKLNLEQRKEVYKTIKKWIKENYAHLLWEEDAWTRLSEIGLIWAIIPLVYAKMESIKVNYSLDKNSYKTLSNSFGDIEKHWKLEGIKNINQFVKTLENVLWKGTVEIGDGKIFVNLNDIKDWTLIAFGNGIQTKKVWNKLEIGWLLDWTILSSTIGAPWKHMNVLWIGKWFFTKWPTKDLKLQLIMQNSISKDKNWKLDILWFNNETKISKLVISQGNDNLINQEYIEVEKQFNKSELSKLIDQTIDGWIFANSEEFTKQYEEIISLVKDYKYDKIVNYINNVVLATKSPLSWYIYHKWWQKILDKIRKDVIQIKDSKDIIKKQVFVEKFINNLFLDENIKTKLNLPGAITNKYIKNMSMKDFDNSNIGKNPANNRTAWFLRAVRNELLGGQNTLNGYLAITWVKWVDRVEKEAEQILSKNKPEWFGKLDSQKQNKVIAFANIVLAWEDYISKSWFEEPTYKTVSVSDIIAFPFTYKLATKTEHGHVPMYGVADLVDVNGDGKFDKKDYTEINSDQVNKYMYSMLSDKFKNSLKEYIRESKWIELNDNQLKELFVKKNLTIGSETINLSYKTIYTKWWECFNSTLAMIDLQLDGAGLWVSAVSGNVYLNNQSSVDVKTYMAWFWRKVDPKSHSEPTNNWTPWGSDWWSTKWTKNPINWGPAGWW